MRPMKLDESIHNVTNTQPDASVRIFRDAWWIKPYLEGTFKTVSEEWSRCTKSAPPEKSTKIWLNHVAKE